MPARHLPALDGLRGLAILLVMVYHQTVLKPQCALDDSYWRVLDAGWCGVDLFFVLSGFLITGILIRSKHHSHYFRNFYARRTLRIFPLYYAVVAFSLILVPHLGAWLEHLPGVARVIDPAVITEKLDKFGRVQGEEAWYWAYLSNIPIAIRGSKHGILDISWSLAIEEQYYLVWPAAVFFLGRRGLIRLCLGMIGAAIAVRLAMIFVFDAGPIAVYVLTPCRWDGLAVGSMLAIVCAEPGGLERSDRTARRWFPWLFGASALVFALDAILGWNVRHELWGSSFGLCMQTIGYTSIALTFGAALILVVVAPAESLVGRFFRSRVMIVFGTYSYALYLFHLPIRALIRDTVFRPESLTIAGSAIPGQLVFYVIATAVTLALALASWYCFERPILSLKRYFPSASAVPREARLKR